jgi:glycosyltransferase involved in cell wall biosynthesis
MRSETRWTIGVPSPANHRAVNAIHIGPDPATIGGMQSVLRTIRDYSVGADCISVVPTWSGRSIRHNAALTAHAARVILAADRRSIVHIHLSNRGAYLRDPPLAALARGRGLRVVVSLHGNNFPEFAQAHPRIVRTALSPAHHVTCLSDGAYSAAKEAVGAARVSQIPNPVAIDLESPPADQTDPVVLFAGVVGLRKGVDILVAAWRKLLDRGIEGTCRIVGPVDDFEPPRLERLTVEGPVDPRNMRQLIRTARVIALPSRSEAMPMILAEALAAGRPFVATMVGGIPSLAPSPGMLVPVGDVDALAGALGGFLMDRALALATGTRAQQFCLDTRSPDIIGARFRAIYAAG